MADTVNLEQAERLVAQLPSQEQLKLVAHICEQLSITLPVAFSEKSADEQARQKQLAKLDAWLAECEKVAELWEGEFDSAADLRRIRDEEV
jgi:HD superfamily phosphodiesterase